MFVGARFFDEVLRPSEVKVRALNLEGKSFEIHADGLLAVCIQHEMDHLKGKVFVEYLSSLKRMRIAGKLKKKQKQALSDVEGCICRNP